MKCAVCTLSTDQDNEYCPYHETARELLKQVYLEWKKAYRGLSWESYLARVSELKGTGIWAREVSRFELKKKNSS